MRAMRGWPGGSLPDPGPWGAARRSLRFAIGGAVIYTNEAGLQFRLSITGFYRPAGPSGLYARGARYLLNSSSPWMPVSESSLRPDDSA